MKPIYSIIPLFLFLTACQPNNLSEVENVEQAKERIDYVLGEWNKGYQELCDGPRNDNQKAKWLDFKLYISEEIASSGEKCINLSYEEQKKVQDYAYAQLERYSNISNLVNSNGLPDCW